MCPLPEANFKMLIFPGRSVFDDAAATFGALHDPRQPVLVESFTTGLVLYALSGENVINIWQE